ncbi:hypothetical protein MHYP_G00267970 [Metynnis hypsauchen]
MVINIKRQLQKLQGLLIYTSDSHLLSTSRRAAFSPRCDLRLDCGLAAPLLRRSGSFSLFSNNTRNHARSADHENVLRLQQT